MDFIRDFTDCTIILANLPEQVSNQIRNDYNLSDDDEFISIYQSILENKYDITDFDLLYSNILLDKNFDEELAQEALEEYVGIHPYYLLIFESRKGITNYYVCNTLLEALERDDDYSIKLKLEFSNKAIYCEETCFSTAVAYHTYIIGISKQDAEDIENSNIDVENYIKQYLN